MVCRRTLRILVALGLLLGVSCSLNPQPEPPDHRGLDFGNTGAPSDSPGPGGPLVVPGASDAAVSGKDELDSTTATEGSPGDGGAASDASTGADAGIDAPGSAADAPEKADALGDASTPADGEGQDDAQADDFQPDGL